MGPPSATTPRIPRPAARIVMLVPGRTSRTMPANGVSTGSAMSPVATRQRSCHSNTNSPPGPRSSPRRGWPVQRPPGRASRVVGTSCSSSRGSRMRSAIGAPTTTESPGETTGRSPGASGNTASIGASMSRRAGTSRTSVMVKARARSRRPSATTRGARRAGRRDPGAAMERHACRRPGRRSRP